MTVALTAAVTGLALVTPAHAAANNAGPGAATWLANQATNGNFGDPGMTADAIVAFVSADVAADHTAAAIEWLDDAAVLSPYIGDSDTGYNAPQTAKILVAANAAGVDSTLGGVDLESTLRSLEGTDGVFTGGYPSVLGQALSVLALSKTADGVSTEAVAALAAAQCDTGGFDFSFGDSDCAGDVDSTGYAVSALIAAGETTASTKALDWLESQQSSTGGFVAGYPGAPENTNSTGLAGQALASGGRDAAATAAAEFIKNLQVPCDGETAYIGAIAYDGSGFDPDNALMATAQVIPALTGEGLAELDASDDTSELPVLDCDEADGDTPGTDPGDDTASKLPATGSSLTWYIAAAALAIAVGAIILVWTRSRWGVRHEEV